MRDINLSSYVQVGEGGTSFTYNDKNDDNVMLKLSKDGVEEDEVIKEYTLSNHISELGFLTPKALSLVKANGKIGIIFEKVKDKVSFSKMMYNDPTKIKRCALEMATYAKKIHSTPCIPEYFINKKDQMKEVVSSLDFSKDVNDALMKKLLTVKDENTCVHGDFQPSNFLDSNGITYMIDIGNFGYGNHMFDIGALYFSCYIVITEEEKVNIFHMPVSDLKIFFDEFSKAYVENGDIEAFYREAKEYGALAMAFAYHILGMPKDKKDIYESIIRDIYGIG